MSHDKILSRPNLCMFWLQHSGGATNISPDSGVNANNDDTYDNYDEWDSYEPVPPPPPPPPAPPMPNGGNGQQFQVSYFDLEDIYPIFVYINII